MLKTLMAAGAAALAFAAASQAQAGPAADALSKCVVGATSAQDRVVLTKWAFVVVSANPELRSMSTVTEPMRDEANHRMADLLTRLVTVNCRAQAVTAVRTEGPQAVQGAVRALGESAAHDLFADPATLASMGGFVKYLDTEKLFSLMKDTGIAAP
jgi:hypothetical protein